jgi:hypothetical protein
MNSTSRRNFSWLIAILFLVVLAPASANNIFGRTNIGTIVSNGLSADYKRGAKFTLSEPAVVTSMNAYLDGYGGPASGYQIIRLAIYQDANGVPGIKVGESTAREMYAQSIAQWYTFPVQNVPLPPGKYWLVIHSGATGGIVRDYADGAPNWYGNADSFADQATSPFGSGGTGTGTISIYAQYALPSELKFAGRSTVGATPSGGLSADFKRASKVTLTEQGQLTGLSAYLDSKGGTSGYQRYRLALYRDSNGVPSTKVTETSEITLQSGLGARWISLDVPAPVVLQAGNYWVAIHTSTTAGILRDFGDGANNWYGNADSYSDHAASPFGSGSAGTGTLSIGFTYQPGTFVQRQFGRTTIGITPSKGLTANYARSQFYSTYNTRLNGPVNGFWAYLDGNGGASGTQQVRVSLYADDCYHGEPATLFSDSEVVNIAAGKPPGWVHFPLKTPANMYEGCGFWLALQSGGTQGVARDYADGNAPWLGVQDTFADGPEYNYPNQAGPGVGLGSGQISMYVEYDVPAPSP